MKRFNFSLAAIAIVLTITAVGCTTMGGPRDDYYNRENARVYGDRVYVEDPYRGTIVLQQDPRTGRYYEVSSPYGYYGNGYYGNGYYGNGYYGNSRYGRRSGYGNSYPNSRRSSGTYRNQPRKQPTPAPRQDPKSREEARKKILGN